MRWPKPAWSVINHRTRPKPGPAFENHHCTILSPTLYPLSHTAYAWTDLALLRMLVGLPYFPPLYKYVVPVSSWSITSRARGSRVSLHFVRPLDCDGRQVRAHDLSSYSRPNERTEEPYECISKPPWKDSQMMSGDNSRKYFYFHVISNWYSQALRIQEDWQHRSQMWENQGVQLRNEPYQMSFKIVNTKHLIQADHTSALQSMQNMICTNFLHIKVHTTNTLVVAIHCTVLHVFNVQRTQRHLVRTQSQISSVLWIWLT